MNENNQEKSALQVGAQAAGAVKSAVKVGKAVAGATKGAAAGPYGMAVGALLSNKTVRNGCVVVSLLLLIPILFVLLLPVMVFGLAADALTAPFNASSDPVMNSDAAIVENIVVTNNELCIIIEEAYADLLADIDNDFEWSGADIKEIINPYSGSNIMNPLIIISQFCASKDQSYEEISLENLVKIVRNNRKKLFSFRKELKWETRLIIERQWNESIREFEDVEVEKMQQVAYYTFAYNGESYFADEIFQLTEEQKTLGDNFYDNLMIYLEGKYNLLIGNPDFSDLIIDYPFTPVPGGFSSPLPSVNWRMHVSDEFGSRGGDHRGIDIAVPYGTPIHAVRAGVVIKSSPWVNSWGEYVAINHGDGMTTLYAHMSRRAIEAGAVVNQGDIIGYVGSTGFSSGNHLHLEVAIEGALKEPRLYLP